MELSRIIAGQTILLLPITTHRKSDARNCWQKNAISCIIAIHLVALNGTNLILTCNMSRLIIWLIQVMADFVWRFHRDPLFPEKPLSFILIGTKMSNKRHRSSPGLLKRSISYIDEAESLDVGGPAGISRMSARLVRPSSILYSTLVEVGGSWNAPRRLLTGSSQHLCE